jgi:hypothetical protein
MWISRAVGPVTVRERSVLLLRRNKIFFFVETGNAFQMKDHLEGIS